MEQEDFFKSSTFLWAILYESLMILTVSNLYRKLESDQGRHVLRIVGSWHVNLVLFCFDGGQVPQRCLVSKFMSSIKCFDLSLTTSAQTIRSMPFLPPISFLSRRSRTFSCLFLNEYNELSRSHSHQINQRRQCLHSFDLLPCGFGQRLLAWPARVNPLKG